MAEKSNQNIPPIKIVVDPSNVNQTDHSQNNLLKTIIILLSSILIIIIAGIAYFFSTYDNFPFLGKSSSDNSLVTQKSPADSGNTADILKNESENIESSQKDSNQPEITSVDNTWNQYQDSNFGISFNFPKKFMHGMGACPYIESDGDHSYRPRPADVKAKIFIDNNNQTIYIAGENFYQLGGETSESGRSFFSSCNLVDNSIDLITAENPRQPYSLALSISEITNEADLTEMIQDQYGEGCQLGQQQATGEEGIFNVKINTGEFNSMEEAEANGCLINYAYKIIYDENAGKALSVSLGQACNLYKNMGGGDNCYDSGIIDSFKFE